MCALVSQSQLDLLHPSDRTHEAARGLELVEQPLCRRLGDAHRSSDQDGARRHALRQQLDDGEDRVVGEREGGHGNRVARFGAFVEPRADVLAEW